MTLALSACLRRLDETTSRLQAANSSGGPGFCLALVSNGEMLRQVHHGMAHLEWQMPIAGNTRFYLASESKPWVAALAMDSVARGTLQLDADVRVHLPVLEGYTQPIRVGHLLRHTSGIADYLFLWNTQLGHHENDLINQSQGLDLIRRAHDVSFAPGSRYEYSNSNYLLLAELLKVLEGHDLARLARQRFFEPWGMAETSFEDWPWRVMPHRARSYERAAGEPGQWVDAPIPLATWGDGGMWSTLDDLIRAEQQWQSAWQANPSGNLLAMCCAEDTLFAPEGQPYRFGLELGQHAGQRVIFHGGSYGAFSSLVLRVPDHSLSLVVLGNSDDFDADATSWTKQLCGE